MDFEWLAALAYPRAIAVHPNFTKQGHSTGPSYLASKVLEEPHDRRTSGEDDTAVEGAAFADLCIAVLLDPSADNLEALEGVMRDDTVDLGQRACAGIVLAAINLESKLPRRDLLDAVIEDVSHQSGPVGRFTFLWLKLGSAVVGIEYGEDQAAEIHAIRVALDEFDTGDEVEFRTTEGLNLAPMTVFSRILEFVTHAALRWEIQLEQLSGSLWIQALRRPTPLILSGLQSNVASGYSEWSKRTFQERVRRQTQVIGGSLLPGDNSMVTSVLVSQFCFHPYGHHAALELGRARFLRGQSLLASDVQSWAIQCALNLMRFSGNRETTQAAVRYTLRHGPLLALTADIDDILLAVEQRGNATHLELDYLCEAATLLSSDQAGRLFEHLSGEWEGTRPPLSERWTIAWVRRESLTKLLGYLSGPAGMGARFVSSLASQLTDEGTEDHDRLLSSAVRAATDITESDAVVLLTRLQATTGYPMLRAALVLRLGEAVVSGYLPANAIENPLDRAIEYVDEVILETRVPDAGQVRKHAAAVEEALFKIRDAVGKGVQSFGGVEPLDVAVAYATVAGDSALWPSILELLTEPSVYRSQKDAALGRIANSAAKVPAGVRDRLKTSLPGLLATTAGFRDGTTNPYPAALRAAAALELVKSYDLMSLLGPWLSSPSISDRLHAVSVLGALPVKSIPAWAIQSLLASTFDADPDVQADAIQALAHVYPNAAPMQDMIVDRANDLLARDGTWLLRKVLAELNGDSAITLRERLSSRIAGLTRHADSRVRKAAVAVASTRT